jgi:hypothetical protein
MLLVLCGPTYAKHMAVRAHTYTAPAQWGGSVRLYHCQLVGHDNCRLVAFMKTE